MSDTLTAPSTSGNTTVLDRPEHQRLDEGDQERFAHFVDQSRFNLVDAMVYGVAVEALCGKRWIPSRDPKRFPVCPTCKEIAKDKYGFDLPANE